MGLVDVGLVGEDDHVVAADNELAGDVGGVLQLQGAVHLDNKLADACVALLGVGKGGLPFRVAVPVPKVVDEKVAQRRARDLHAESLGQSWRLASLVGPELHVLADLVESDLGWGMRFGLMAACGVWGYLSHGG